MARATHERNRRGPASGPAPRAQLARLLALALLLGSSGGASAEVTVRDAWIDWNPRVLPHRAFFDITNNLSEAVTLVGARSKDHGRASFKAAPDQDPWILDPLEMPQILAPGETLRFHADGGPYLILYLQHMPMDPGDTTTIELLFRNREPVAAEFTVRR